MGDTILTRDIMTKEVISIKPTTSIIEAIDILLERRISGLPVLDDEGRIAGIVSELDLLHVLFQKNVQVADQVQKYMSKKITFFKEEDSAYDVCGFFLKHNVRRVPIVDNENRLTGIVSRRDVLQVVLATVLNLEHNDEGSADL